MQRMVSIPLTAIILSFVLSGCVTQNESSQSAGGSLNGAAQASLNPAPAAQSPSVLVAPNALPSNCDPAFQNLLTALNMPTDWEAFKYEYVRFNLSDPTGHARAVDAYLPFKSGRYYFPLEWLRAVDIEVAWNKNRRILRLMNKEKTQCLFMQAEEPNAPAGQRSAVTLAIANNAFEMNVWLTARAKGYEQPLLPNPKVKVLCVQSAALSLNGDPMMTLRAVLAALGANYKAIKPHIPEGQITATNPVQLDIALNGPVQELETKAHAVIDLADDQCPILGIGQR